MNKVLLTGGSGYIGSHTCLRLLQKGYKVIVLDSCINSSSKALKNVLKILNKEEKSKKNYVDFIKGDINDREKLIEIFNKAIEDNEPISGVIHFAGLKSVNESIQNPIKYWEANVSGTINLLSVMDLFNCNNIIFSSSATIYGLNKPEPVKENTPIDPINPYGSTKATIEKFLKDLFESEKEKWSIINLRYFNPIGAHPSGIIGESPTLLPNNIFPLILDVALGKKNEFHIFGNDWDTYDGTCIRDYIHVMDLADAHVKAFEFLFNNTSRYLCLNIGTGKGTSVLELINTFQKVNNVKVKYRFTTRRDGDAPNVVANNVMAKKILNWIPKRNIMDMCRDGWNWKALNPEGY